jgi:tetratricopeptide (TPR) repeat protein
VPAPVAPRHDRFPLAWTIALIFGATLACYWPALRGDFLWDDQAHVTAPELRSLAGLGRIWTDVHATQQYYPAVHSAFWLEHRLWGDATLGYHLINVLLHVSAAGLLVVLLRRLRVPGAALAGLIFAVHPVCVESVAWISEQKNTLSLVCYLLAALAYLRFDERRGRPGAWRAYAMASLLFALALLSKSVTATLPAALLVIQWWRSGRLSWRREVIPLLPWLAAALASGLFTAWVERTIIGAEGAAFDLSLLQRLALAGRVIGFYLGKLVWPARLAFFYPRWNVPAAAIAWLGYGAAVVALTAAFWIFRARNRGPLAAWLFFIGSLFPALGFFNVYPFRHSYVADHFQYLASLGIITAAAAAATTLAASLAPSWRAVSMVVGGVSIATLGLLSRAQTRNYTDGRTLYEATLRLNPESWIAHNNLGRELFETKAADLVPAAIGHFEAALRVRPDYAEAHYNLGNALLRAGRPPAEAIVHYEAAVRLRPSYADAHNNLGNALAQLPGRLPDAIAEYRTALQFEPALPETHFNLGNGLLKTLGRRNEAIAEFETVLRLRPDHFAAHRNLGFAWSDLPGRLNDAIDQYRIAARLKPDDAEVHYDLGNAWQRLPGHLEDAVAEYREALRLQPSHAEAHNNLGGVLSQLPGHVPEAIAECKFALRLNPNYAEAHYNLAALLVRLPGRAAEADEHLQSFARLWPNPDEAQALVARLRSRRP